MDAGLRYERPEVLLAKEFSNELGIDINPQALRIFIRSKWSRISTLAHSIHGTEPEKATEIPTCNPGR